jgi:hypothetical protein
MPRMTDLARIAVAASTLALFVKAAFVIGAMAIGLLGGSRLAGLAASIARRS